MKWLAVLFACLVAPTLLMAQTASLDGDWTAPFTTPQGLTIRLVIHLGEKVTVDSPDQGAKGLDAALTRNGEQVVVDAPTAHLKFELTPNSADQTLSGHLLQGGLSFPISFHRGLNAYNRPQTPTPPFPYRSIEVSYPNPKAPGVVLAGTLTLPQGAGPFPVALLITGSGAQDRDETIFDHKPYLILADALTRRGIAVLRLDDRGVGGSTGASASDTSADFAGDVRAGVAFLKARPDIDAKRIGLIGHSDGGAIALRVAAKDPSIAFVVMLAGAGVRGDDLLAEQNRRVDLAAGLSKALADQDYANKLALFQAVAKASDEAQAKAAGAQVLSARGVSATDGQRLLAAATAPWMRAMLAYDPAPDLAAIQAPILALNGTLDVQVPADQNLPAIKSANPRAETIALPGLNHLFQTAKTGSPTEYAQIEESFSPAALTLIVDWVAKTTSARS